MFEDVRTGLGGVTLDAAGVDAVGCGAAFRDCGALVRAMTVAATHLAIHHGMAEWEIEFATLIQVALEARLRRVAGIDDRARLTACFHVERGRSVAGFALEIGAVASGGLKFGVCRIMECARELFVALGALLRADIGRSGHLRRCDDGAFGHHAGNEEQAP